MARSSLDLFGDTVAASSVACGIAAGAFVQAQCGWVYAASGVALFGLVALFRFGQLAGRGERIDV